MNEWSALVLADDRTKGTSHRSAMATNLREEPVGFGFGGDCYPSHLSIPPLLLFAAGGTSHIISTAWFTVHGSYTRGITWVVRPDNNAQRNARGRRRGH